MSVYKGDKEKFFKLAFRSVAIYQTYLPGEIILIIDGKLNSKFLNVISKEINKVFIPVFILILPIQKGLSNALNIALKMSKYKIIARMDSDDISMVNRFEEQVKRMQNGLDLIGSDIAEFDKDENSLYCVRRMPTNQYDIMRQARFKTPFNHPTIMYKKSSVLSNGGYDNFPFMEDYALFVKMLLNGAQMTNVPSILLKYRVGSGVFKRKSGLSMIKYDIYLQNYFFNKKFINIYQFMRNIFIRFIYRLISEKVKIIIYRKIHTVSINKYLNKNL